MDNYWSPVSSEFQQSLDQFLLNCQQAVTGEPQSLSQTKITFNQVFELLTSVQQQSASLQDNLLTIPDSEWTTATQTVIEQQKILSDLLEYLSSPQHVSACTRLIRKRRKKRTRIRKATEKRRAKPVQPLIPEPLIVKPVLQPDQLVIRPVSTHKSNNTTKYLNLFGALTELHRLRESQSTSSSRSDFCRKLAPLVSLWQEAKEYYEQQAKRERDLHKTGPDQEVDPADSNVVETIEQQWKRIMFGSPHGYSLQSGYEPDLERVFAVRRGWDRFLCDADQPDGSAIIPFVIPESINREWLAKQDEEDH